MDQGFILKIRLEKRIQGAQLLAMNHSGQEKKQNKVKERSHERDLLGYASIPNNQNIQQPTDIDPRKTLTSYS